MMKIHLILISTLYLMLIGSAQAQTQEQNREFDSVLMIFRNNVPPSNIQRIVNLADQGNPDAQFYLARLHQRGFPRPYSGYALHTRAVVEQDAARALELMRTAAEGGSQLAQLWMAESYFRGRGVEMNYYRAAEFYELAVVQGPVAEMTGNALQEEIELNRVSRILGRFGFLQREKNSIFWERVDAAVHNNDAEAMYHLGDFLFEEFGRDYIYEGGPTIFWMSLSASQNNAEALEFLGRMYYFNDNDFYNLPHDRALGEQLLTLAAEAGSQPAREAIHYIEGERLSEERRQATYAAIWSGVISILSSTTLSSPAPTSSSTQPCHGCIPLDLAAAWLD